ncbi:hypothetical protein HMPREF1861_02025 [Corynebacterium kroppenstedtii]|nr:hypothetical protein HMPREF1861_02025 [Corynebacterium kroppenstedtii]
MDKLGWSVDNRGGDHFIHNRGLVIPCYIHRFGAVIHRSMCQKFVATDLILATVLQSEL